MKVRSILTGTVILTGAIAGLVIGYAIFGEIAGQRVPVEYLLTFDDGAIRGFVNDLAGINEIRQKILLTGAAGLVLGIIQAVALGRSRKKR